MITRTEFRKQYYGESESESESERSPLEANLQRVVNPSVSLKTNKDESFTTVYNLEVKSFCFFGCRFESVNI